MRPASTSAGNKNSVRPSKGYRPTARDPDDEAVISQRERRTAKHADGSPRTRKKPRVVDSDSDSSDDEPLQQSARRISAELASPYKVPETKHKSSAIPVLQRRASAPGSSSAPTHGVASHASLSRSTSHRPAQPPTPSIQSTSRQQSSLAKTPIVARSATASSSLSSGPPFSVRTVDGERIIRPPLDLDLNFDFPSPDARRSTAAETAKNRMGARVGGLDDADAFLGFALARGCIGIWETMHVDSQTDYIKGTCVVQLKLSPGEGPPKQLVQVTATVSRKLAGEMDKTTKLAELCAKMELVRALVEPSTTSSDFLAQINPTLEGRTDDKEKDSEGRNLFERYRCDHPLRLIKAIQARLERAGTLGYDDDCASLVNAIANGLGQSSEGVMEEVGFGPWAGSFAAGLRKCFVCMHRFCGTEPAYLEDSINTCKAILELCIRARGGADAEAFIKHWLNQIEKEHEKAVKAGKKTNRQLKRSTDPTPAPARKRVRVEPAAASVPVAVEPRTAPAPTVDPRLALRAVHRTPTPVPIPQPRVEPTKPLTTEPESMDLDEPGGSLALPTPSPRFDHTMKCPSPAISPLLPIAPAFSPPPAFSPVAPPATYLPASSNSTPQELAMRVSSDELEFVKPPLPLHRSPSRASTARPHSQSPMRATPERTPEVSSLPRAASYCSELVWTTQQLLAPQLISVKKDKSLYDFWFSLEEDLRARVAQVLTPASEALQENELPLRVRAVFRRSSADDELRWPSTHLKTNSAAPTPLTRSRFETFYALDLSPHVVTGPNKVQFTKWRQDILPEDLTLAIEIGPCASEPWLRARAVPTEDAKSKTHELYTNRSSVPIPTPVDLRDPTTEKVICVPVRGPDCEHLEAFDLDTYLATNRVKGEWRCPRPECTALALPHELAIDSWQLEAIQDDPTMESISLALADEDAKPKVEDTYDA